MSITNVENSNRSTRLLAQTTLRNVLGTKNLSEILADREVISHVMQVITESESGSLLYVLIKANITGWEINGKQIADFIGRFQ